MKYEKSIASQMFVDDTDVIQASHKGVTLDFIIDKDSLMIIYLVSNNSNKGEAQEALNLLKADYPDKHVIATIPLCSAAKHIFDKLAIEYTEEGEED
jgi:hypothetical protein